MNLRPGMSLLSVVSNIERHKIGSGEDVILLMDLAWPGGVPADEQQHLRLARYPDEVNYDANDGLGEQEYTPFSFMLGDVKLSTDGSFPESELQADNIMQALEQAIEEYAGGVGADLQIYVVNTANPAGEPELALSFTVKSTSSDAKLVHFKLGASSPMRKLFPWAKYRPNSCIWDYNSPTLQAAYAAAVAAGKPTNRLRGQQCQYQGPMPTCSKTIDGPTGCIAHDNLVRIGTFPGIDSNGVAVASVA